MRSCWLFFKCGVDKIHRLVYERSSPVMLQGVQRDQGATSFCFYLQNFDAVSVRYRTQWLLNIPNGPDKTFVTTKPEVHVVESWESPDAFPSTYGNKTRTIHCYTDAPTVELLVNGKSVGPALPVTPMVKGPGSYAEVCCSPRLPFCLSLPFHVIARAIPLTWPHR